MQMSWRSTLRDLDLCFASDTTGYSMWIVFLHVLLLWATLLLVGAGDNDIILNVNASVYRSIKSMHHDAVNRRVTIELHKHRRSHNPTFIGRLSGTALYLLDLEEHKYERITSAHNVSEFMQAHLSSYTYTYQPIVDSGTYYLEFLVLYATDFSPDDVLRQCLEEPEDGKNIINLPYKLELKAAQEKEFLQLPTKKARWLLSETSDARYTLAPLPTRYQHRSCEDGIACEHAWKTQSEGELWQHRLYSWAGKPDWWAAFQSSNRTDITHICIVGDSHARSLWEFGQELLNGERDAAVMFSFFWCRYPHLFDAGGYEYRQCDYVVVSQGQWAASYLPVPGPYTATKFKSEMTNMMKPLSPLNYQGLAKFLFLSLDYVPLSAAIASCPPYDFRSVPMIQAYNAIIKDLAAEHRLQSLDLSHIIGPMWDSAADFCHPRLRVFTAQIEWVLYHIFSSSPPPRVTWPPRLMRLNKQQTVYLVANGVGRAFPDGHTFMAMGYDFGDVMVVNNPRAFKVGPELPAL